MTNNETTISEPSESWTPGFAEYLLGGILVLMVVGALLAAFVYLLPPDQLQLPELQPAMRVGPQSEFPIGGSRLVRWGDQTVLVVRSDTNAYAALQATAPTDGCILHWDATAMRVASDCEYIIYDLHGNVVRGVTRVPLKTYPTYVRDGVVWVGRP